MIWPAGGLHLITSRHGATLVRQVSPKSKYKRLSLNTNSMIDQLADVLVQQAPYNLN
jgi:hypothetical protein